MTDSPSTIGRYQVVNRIARGGMGTLYLAWDPKLDRQIAIKILTENNDDLRERFAREARSVARLHHPHIVTIFDVGESDGRPFIAMEYIQGETLATLIRNRLSLTTARKLEIIEELCEGLAFAHKAGIIHRDIKPANIMLEPGGSLKILDFGIARATQSSTMTSAGMLIGTLNYMSPEQVAGRVADNRSDVYAVGAVMYELLSYRQAFPGGLNDGILHRLMNESPEPLERVCPGLDPEIPRIVGKALEKSARDRYQDLGAMFADVRATRVRLPVDEAELSDTIGTTINIHRTPISTPVPLTTPTPVADAGRRAVDRDELVRRRAKRIESHVEAAERAFAAGDYDAGITECEQALMLDADDVRVLELLDRGRAVLDERRAAEILTEAADEIRRGALTSALAKIDRAAALHPSSPRVEELRKALEEALAARERARQRAEAIRAVLERAHARYDEGSFQAAVAAADEALALDPGLSEAEALKSAALEAIAEHERELLERRARDAVRDARRLFAADERTAAIDLLAQFQPPHELVSQTLEQLRAEAARLEAQRRLEAEQRARRERVAAELSNVRDDMAAEDFASALDRLRALEEAEGGSAEFASLKTDAEAGLAAQELAARKAEEIAAHVARAAGLLARQDPSGALDSVDAALVLDPTHKGARALRAKIEDRLRAQAALREAEERRNRKRDQAVAAAIAKAKRATSHQSAIAALGEALDLAPDHPEARQLLEARQSALASEQAERQRLQEIETARKAEIQQMLAAGRDRLRRDDVSGAREAVGRLRELDPKNQDARSLLDDIELAEERRRSEVVPVAEPPAAVEAPVQTDAGLQARGNIPTVQVPAAAQPPAAVRTEAPKPRAVEVPTHARIAPARNAYPILAGAAGIIVVAVIGYLAFGRSSTPPASSSDSVGRTAAVPVTSAPGQASAPPANPNPQPPVPSGSAAPTAPVAVPSPPPSSANPAAAPNARLDQELDRLRRLARDQFSRGERQQALITVKSALKQRPDDAQLKTLLNDVFTDARAKLRRARDAATAAGEGVTRSSSYREGVRREEEAAQLSRSGKSDEALRAAWLATDLFDKAAAEAKPGPPAAVVSAPAAPPTQTRADARPAEQRPEPTPPPAAAPSPAASAPTPAPTPAPPPETVTPVRPAPPPPVTTPAPTPVSEDSAIRAVLRAYVDAYSRLDAGGVRRVFPTINEQALTQAFSTYRSQQVQLRDERITITGTTAVVSCTLDTNFVPKVGAPQRVSPKVTLRLQKAGAAWVIVDRR